MTNALKTFQDGEKITAEDTNNNNKYLEELNSEIAAELRNYLEGEISKLKADISGSIIKAGTVIILPHEKSIDGSLKCDGSSLLRSDYEDLFNEIGTIYGAVDDYHFNVPDWQGMFLRGAGGNAATLGTKQECALPNIKGTLSGTRPASTSISGAFQQDRLGNTWASGDDSIRSNQQSFNASRSSSVYKDGVDEVRVVNYAVNFWIKY